MIDRAFSFFSDVMSISNSCMPKFGEFPFIAIDCKLCQKKITILLTRNTRVGKRDDSVFFFNFVGFLAVWKVVRFIRQQFEHELIPLVPSSG